jgi:hypothetical protein
MNITLRSGTRLETGSLQHGDSRNNLNSEEASVGTVLVRRGGRRSGRGRGNVRQSANGLSNRSTSRIADMRDNDGNISHTNRNVNEEVNELRAMINSLQQELATRREESTRLTNEIDNSRIDNVNSSREAIGRSGRPGFKEAIKKTFLFSGDGENDYEDWRDQVKLSVFSVYDLTEEEKVMYLTANLEGQARRFILSGNQNPMSLTRLEDFDKAMKEGFEGRIDWHSKFFGCKQQANEKIRIYVNKLQVFSRKMLPNGTKEEVDKLCLNQIKQHALPEHKMVLKYINLDQPLEDVIKQLTTNENMEEVTKGKKRKESEMMNNVEVVQLQQAEEIMIIKEKNESEASSMKKLKEDFGNTTKQIKDSFRSQMANVSEVLQKNQEQMNQLMTVYKQREQMNEVGNKTRRVLKCYFCGKPGHGFNRCRDATQNDKNKIGQQLRDRTFDFSKLEQH